MILNALCLQHQEKKLPGIWRICNIVSYPSTTVDGRSCWSVYAWDRGFSCDVISSQCCKLSSCDRYVDFFSHCPVLGKRDKLCCYFLFSSYCNTKLRLSDRNVSTHALLKFQILLWSKSKLTVCFVCLFFLDTAPYKKETKGRGKIMHMCVYVVQALYWM